MRNGTEVVEDAVVEDAVVEDAVVEDAVVEDEMVEQMCNEAPAGASRYAVYADTRAATKLPKSPAGIGFMFAP
jgi:hypothetical protein